MKGKDKIYFYIGSTLILWMTIFTYMNGNIQSLWVDELSSIGYIRGGVSFKDMLYTYLFCDTNLPLYSLILYFVYRIIPYGEQYLLIPSIVFCAAGIMIFSHCVKKVIGVKAGFITLCLCCASNSLIWQGVWEVRCYSLTFFLAVITLRCFIEKMQEPNLKNYILYSAAVLLFISTHWFACLVLAFYGLTDLFLIVSKKISWKGLFVYIPALLFFLPWAAVTFMTKQEEITDFWGIIPEWKNILWTILFWLSGRRVLWYICLLTGSVYCIKWIINIIKKQKNHHLRDVFVTWCMMTIGWVLGVVFVYSKILNPEGSLYIERYFVVIVPQIIFITAIGLDGIILWLDKAVEEKYVEYDFINKLIFVSGRILVVAILTISLGLCYKEEYIAIRKPFEKFREAADDMILDGRIWEENTLFVASNRYCVLDGFTEYYFEKRGYKPPRNIIDGGIHSISESRFYPNYKQYSENELLVYDTIMCLRIHMHYDEAFGKFLEKYYEEVQSAEENGVEIWSKKLFIESKM